MFDRTAAARLLIALITMTPSPHAASECRPRPDAAASLATIETVMATGRFVAYHPTSLRWVDGAWTAVDPASVRADLALLRPRFDGLITYGAVRGADRIADIAAELGYRAVIVGVWDIGDREELDRALAAADRQPRVVVGLGLGNERVFAKEATFTDIAAAIERARARAPRLALTSSEPFHLYRLPDARPALAASDLVLVNVHPVFQPWFATEPDATAAQFVVNVVDDLKPLACGPILVKETGVPTAPADAGYTPARQASFYAALRARFPPSSTRAFAYFSAFDAPWRVHDANPVPGEHPEEAHWGLYDADRRPKPAAVDLMPLTNVGIPSP
jgi:exo-beta-1,3-glucanase (GH17 family)